MATNLTATTIDQLWAALQSNGYYTPSALNVPANNALGSPGIDALLGDTALFPGKALAMKVTATEPPGTAIVITGTFIGNFLGQSTAAVVATFTIDGNGAPTLSLAVTATSGTVLAAAFPALPSDSAPAVQPFSASSFTASSGTPPTLQFSGTPDLSATDYAMLWSGTPPTLTGFITSWANDPVFDLTTPFAMASTQVGTARFQVQMSLTADGTATDAAGALTGLIVSPGTKLDGLKPTTSLPISAGALVFDTGALTGINLPDLGDLSALFLGQQLAALIPAQFSLGTLVNLGEVQLSLATGGATIVTTQVNVNTGQTLTWPLLPADLLTLTQIGATFAWSGGTSVDIAFGGNFSLGGNPKLGFYAAFSLPQKQLTAFNTSRFDVGELLTPFGIKQAPHTGMTVEQLTGTLSIPDKTWRFAGNVTLSDAWSISLMGETAIGLDTVALTIAQTSSSRTIQFSAVATLFGSNFQITAGTSTNNGWAFAGLLAQPLPLANVTKALLPFAFDPPDITIQSLSVAVDTGEDSFSFDTVVDWTIAEIDTEITAEFQLARAGSQYSGFLKGEVDVHGLVLEVRYDFSPTSTGISFAYRSLTISYHKDASDPTVTISLGRGTVGDLFDFLLSFADPGRTLSLGAPWDAFEKIELPAIAVTVNLTTKAISVELDHVVNLGFLDLEKIVLNYSRDYGTPRFNLQLSGTFLGQPYGTGGNPPLQWDALNDPPPAVPGTGTQVLDLEFLGLGQRVAIADSVPTEMDKIIDALEAAMRPPANPGENPVVALDKLTYNAGSSWLIGTRFTVMSTLRMDLIFNDPTVYGLLIQLSGEKAGLFAGLRFEILYRKVTDTIGVYHIELTLPDEMRHLEFGEVSITLPVVTLDIYTNGNFRVDFGFPPSLTDFSRSFSIQVFPFAGFGGFYFALLDGQTSTNVPKVTSGHFGTVVEFGLALQIGVGKTLSLGILSGGISITVGGMLQGVLGWYTPNDSNLPSERYHHITGTVALIGKVYATVDFGILQASVSLTVYASISLDVESYKAILIEVSAGVSVEVSIKILFIRIHFSFSATITEHFVIGSDSTPPWTLAAPGAGQGNAGLLRGRRDYRARPVKLRLPPYALLRSRPPRPLQLGRSRVLGAAATGAIAVPVLVVPIVSQALCADFAFPSGPTLPSGTTTPVLGVLLGLQTSTNPIDGANQLLGFLLDWVIDAIGHEHDTASAAVLEESLETLSDSAACDSYFAYSALTSLFETNGIVFTLAPRPTTGNATDEVPAALLAMIPELKLSTPDFGIDFTADRRVNADYEQSIRTYFATLSAKFGSSPAAPHAATNSSVESLATFLFRYQFYMLTKAVVQGARDWLNASTLTLPAPASLTTVANLYNNNYMARPGDTLATIAAMFGLTTADLAASNPDVPASGPSVGEAIFIPAQLVAYTSQPKDTLANLAACFGIDPAALQAANPHIDFDALTPGTTLSIPAMRILHNVVAGETAMSIASDFVINPAALAAANPGVDMQALTVGQTLLIPDQLSPLAVATVNATTPGLLDDTSIITLQNIQLTAAASDTISSLAAQFGIAAQALLDANAESVALLNPGQQIALGQLSTTTRASDSIDGISAYWYGVGSISLTALSVANPALTIVSGQGLTIPNGTNPDQDYQTQSGDTFAKILTKNPGLTVEALVTNNKPIAFDPGQPVTLPNVVHTTSTSYEVVYTATSGDTYTTIAAAFFTADRVEAATTLLQQINGTAPPVPGSRVHIPFASSVANLTRQYGVSSATLAGNSAMGQASALAARASITIASTTHALTQTDTLAGIAQAYDLSLEQLVSQIATFDGLLAAVSIKIPAIPAMRIDRLTAALATSGRFTNALNMTSRFLAGGLRIPAPTFQTDPNHVTSSVPNSPQTYPLYALVGQEFPVNPAPPSGYEISVTANAVTWVTPPATSFPLDQGEIALITAFATLAFNPGLTAGAAQPIAAFANVPDRQPPAALLWWQTPDLIAFPADAKVVQPSIWMMPVPLTDALAASPSAMLAYAGNLGTTAADGTVEVAPLAASRFATIFDLTIETVPGSPPGLYNVVGTDQSGLQRLIALWEHLSLNGGTADLFIAYASQDPGAPSGTLVSDVLDRQDSFLVKTNLSTESNAPPALRDSGPRRVLNTPISDASSANLTAQQSLDFLQFLWECSAVRSGGFYLRYVAGSGKPGLPDGLFKAGHSAQIKLVVAASDQPANVPVAMAYNNALIVGDNEDPAQQTLFFEAVCYTVVAGDTLTSAAASISTLYPGLPVMIDGSTLATTNQLIPGTLIAGVQIAGQTVQPDDCLLSLAQRAGLTVAALAAQIQATPCLNPGAILQLIGEPIQTVVDGDTLVSISQAHSYLDPASLAALNATTPNLLAVGQTITVPGHADHSIAQGDTLGGIASAAGLPVTVLGEANATAPILAAKAGIVVAADTIRTRASLPPGRTGFALNRVNPDPNDKNSSDPQTALNQLYQMVGFEIAAGGGFAASGEGLPATPANQDADDSDALWHYRQVLAVYPFAMQAPVVMPMALPAANDDPYAGIATGAAVALQLAVQDVLGNRTTGSVVPGVGSGPAVTVPIGYTDELISPAAWPSLVASYRFAPQTPNLLVAFSVSSAEYLPDASAAPMIAGAPNPANSGAASRAGQASARYAAIHYQLLQADIECALSTTLGPVSNPAPLSDTIRATLRGVAASAYVYLSNAATLTLTTVGKAQGFTDLAALVTPATTGAGAGFPVSWDDLASANANAEAALIFGEAVPIAVPLFRTTLSSETPAGFIARIGIGDDAAIASANASVALTAGVVLNIVTSAVPTALARGSLAQMAQALNCAIVDSPGAVPGLASSNAAALLVRNTTLSIGNQSCTTGESDTLQSVANALGGLAHTTYSVSDVAAANVQIAPLFVDDQPLTIANAVAVAGDTLASFGTGHGGQTPAELLAANLQVPGVWPPSTALFIENQPYVISAADTIASIASANNAAAGLILSNNAALPLASAASLVIPWSADTASLAAGTHVASGGTLEDIAGLFPNWSLAQLAADNLNWPGLFAPVPITIGQHSVTPSIDDSFATLAAAFGLAPADFAQQAGQLTGIVRPGAVFVTPPMQSQTGETFGALAQRFGTDSASLATANACLPGLFSPGESFVVAGMKVMLFVNDTLALVAARVNAALTAAGLAPLSVGEIGAAAADVPVLARTLLGVPAPATIAAQVTAADVQPILSLAVDLAVSRDPALVSPAFSKASHVLSATAAIAAAPFAASGSQPKSLDQFAADFEAAFAGHKIATGPQHTTFAPVVSKASLRGTAGGGTGATSSGTTRSLWVVNFSSTGITYRIDPTQTRFFAVQPLSTLSVSADNVTVPNYVSGTGLSGTKTQNFRNGDPDDWNLTFLQAIDLVLSPAYAAAAQSDPQASASLTTIIAAKGQIADSLATLVAPIANGQTDGLPDAVSAMTQQLLVELGSLYLTQAIVQFGIDVGASSAQGAGTPPRLAGKLKVGVVTTPSINIPVDPKKPFAALAEIAAVAPSYLAEAIADVPSIISAGVLIEYSGRGQRTTLAGDTVATIAASFSVTPDELAQGLTLVLADTPLFRPEMPVNMSTVTVPQALTTITAAAEWLGTAIADLLTANASRTDVFAPQSIVTIGTIAYTPQPQDTLVMVAAKFGGLSSLAQGLSEVDSGSEKGSYNLNPAAPLRALQGLPQISFQSTKAGLSQGATITSLLTVNRPSEQRKLVLNLDFAPNQLEFDIYGIAGVAGYEGSSWLSFVRPLDPAPNTIGQVAVPIALRGYPVPAVISGQQALPPASGGEPDSTLTQWTYSFNAQRPFAAQDEMTLEISFNDSSPTCGALNDTVDRSAVVQVLAGFSTIWPAVAKDLAAMPLLLSSASPDQQAAARAAVAALAQTATDVASAWATVKAVALDASTPTSFQYKLSTLIAADGTVDALMLDRLGQATDFSEPPDTFLFLTDPGYAADLANRQIPAGLAADFAAHGLPLSANAAVAPSPSSAADWMIIDSGEPSPAIAPQTWRLLLQAGPSPTLQVWRQLLWPDLALAGPGPSTPLSCTQAGTRLTYALPGGQDISDGTPLDLQFSFYRLDAMTLADAWGGFWISRNANLVDNVNSGFIYETPLTRFPTRITPYIKRPDPVALVGNSLVDALSRLLKELFAGLASLTGQGEALRLPLPTTRADSSAVTRNVRIQAGYWRSPGGGNPVGDPMSFRNPLLLVPMFPFDVVNDWQPGQPHFCQTLADAMQANANAMGIVPSHGDLWAVDILVYGDGANDQQPLLLIANHYYPVSA